MGGFALNAVAYSPLDVYSVRTPEAEGEAGEIEIDSGHFLCYNPYQVLNDLNKFNQDKYLGEILKRQRQARAQKITYDVDLLQIPIKEEDIQRLKLNHPEMYDFDDASQNFTADHVTPSILKVDKPVKVSTRSLCNYIDSLRLHKGNHFECESGKIIVHRQLGQRYEPTSDEICIWELKRKQLSKGHNGDADDTIYYYLTADAHVDDYFYSSHS
jgi:hypothetical protein